MLMKVSIIVTGLFACGAGLMLLIHRMKPGDAAGRKADWVKYGVFMLVVLVCLAAACTERFIFGGVLGILAVLMITEIRRHVGNRRFGVFLSLCIITGLAHMLLVAGPDRAGATMLLLLLVFITDSYAQLLGRLIGKRHLCPHLSPHKTIAGFWGGIGAAAAAALVLSFLLPRLGLWPVFLLGLATALGAVAGDLVFSRVKRRLGIKDFSGLLPGHGGVIDRFDSLVVAGPVFFWMYQAMDYVNGGVS